MTDKQAKRETLDELEIRFLHAGVKWSELLRWYWELLVGFRKAKVERDRYRAALEDFACRLLERGFERSDIEAILSYHGIDPGDFNE